jgi:hypothetical protein
VVVGVVKATVGGVEITTGITEEELDDDEELVDVVLVPVVVVVVTVFAFVGGVIGVVVDLAGGV